MSGQRHESNEQHGQQSRPTQAQSAESHSQELHSGQTVRLPPYSAQPYPQQPAWQYSPHSGGYPGSPHPGGYPAGPYPPKLYFTRSERGKGQFERAFLTAVVPWTAARFLLKPKTGERFRDRKLTLLASWRAVLAALVVTLSLFNFRQPWGKALSGASETLTHIWVPAVLLAPVLFAVLLAATRSGHRSKLLPGAPRMLWRLLLGAVCIALSLLVLVNTSDKTPSKGQHTVVSFDENGHRTETHYQDTYYGDGNTVSVAEDGSKVTSYEDTGDNALTNGVEALLAYGWLPLFGGCAVYWAVRSGLWLGEIHPLLGPIGSISLMLLITGQEMTELDPKGMPLPWWSVLIGCGIVGTLALAVFECRRARVVGFRIRSGPEPMPQDRGVASSDAPTLPRGLRVSARRPFWIRPEAFPRTGAAVEDSSRYWARLRDVAVAVGNASSALFLLAGSMIAKPFAPIARFVRRKQAARRDSGPAVAVKTKPATSAIVVFPWVAARSLFKPEVGPLQRDRLLDRLGFWRTVTGLLVVVAATIGHRHVWDLVSDLAGKGVATLGLAAFIAPAPIAIALDAMRRGYGPQMRQGFLRILKRIALGLAVAVPLPVLIIVGCVVGIVFVVVTGAYPLLVLAPLAIVALLWCVPFVVCTFYWAVRSCVWMSEINPLLAPLAGTVFAAAISIEEVAEGDSKGVPVALWLTLNIFGLISTVLLGIAEYRHAESLGYQLLRYQETVAVPVTPPQPSSAVVRPVLRGLRRLAGEHFRYVQKTDR